MSHLSLAASQARQIDTRVVVETPEGVDFRFLIAGPGKRGAAFLADLALKLAITIGLAIGLSAFTAFGGIGEGYAIGLFLLILFIVNWFYSGLFESLWNGQTPGKRSFQLRVVRTNGTPISPLNAIGRNLLSAADCLPPALIFPTWNVGLLAMFANPRMQRLGDLLFDTMVVDERREWVSRATGITDTVEVIPRSECSARYSVPERTLAVIERLFEGDRRISDGRQEEISRPVSLALRRRLGWEEPGPDPSNPHMYFTQVPNRHTTFLKRILKTFSDDPGTREENSRTLASATQRRIRPQSTAPDRVSAGSTVDVFRGVEGTLDSFSIDWSPRVESTAAATAVAAPSVPISDGSPAE